MTEGRAPHGMRPTGPGSKDRIIFEGLLRSEESSPATRKNLERTGSASHNLMQRAPISDKHCFVIR